MAPKCPALGEGGKRREGEGEGRDNERECVERDKEKGPGHPLTHAPRGGRDKDDGFRICFTRVKPVVFEVFRGGRWTHPPLQMTAIFRGG